jgi:hypothetical protein
MGSTTLSDIPTSLVDLLSNTLILRQTAPYLPVTSVCALAKTCRALRHIICQFPEAFRYLDLSPIKAAICPIDEPLDSGGNNWRRERVDESLTEDEFYSGPLRNIFARLEQQHLLRNVHTLVLDGLSVTAELVKELMTEERYNVRILSIREVKHLNERKLQQYLRYVVRPSRPAGTPRVKGIYLFGPRDSAPLTKFTKHSASPVSQGVMGSQGARIGAEWNQKSTDALNTALAKTEDKWYRASGRMMVKRPSADWAEILQACEGLITFDAVLCRGPRHVSNLANPAAVTLPTIANVALGPSGCESCNSCPEGPALFGHSPPSYFPLLSPVPLHWSSIRAAQTPHTLDGSKSPPLFARCEECLKGRWCERCHKWWDEDCYAGSTLTQRTELQQTEFIESLEPDGTTTVISKQTIKVHMGLCVEHCLVDEWMSGAGGNGMWG